MSILRRLRHRFTPSPVQRYRAGGRIPWSDGYREARQQFVAASLSDPALMAAFARRETLPAGYGLGFDERCVEYPWALARIPPGPGRVLDAGSTLNHAAVLDHPLWQDKVLHIVTLAPDGLAFWKRGISHLYEDLRDLPLQNNLYDTVVCISTLAHVGLDNSSYTRQAAHREQRPAAFPVQADGAAAARAVACLKLIKPA